MLVCRFATLSTMDRASDLDLSTTITLRSGVQIPLFGLGTWLSGNNGECAVAVRAALDAGYRSLSTGVRLRKCWRGTSRRT